MRYSIGGEELARLLIAAGGRMDADEIGEIVHRVKLIVEPADHPSSGDGISQEAWEAAMAPLPPAKPE